MRRCDLLAGDLCTYMPLNFRFKDTSVEAVETAEHREVPWNGSVLLQFCYDLPRQSIYSPLPAGLGRFFYIVPEQGLARTDFHDLIIGIYGLLGHRLVLYGAAKGVNRAAPLA